jgi:hypothetical protein
VVDLSGREPRVNRCRLAIASGLAVSTVVLGGCSNESDPESAPSRSAADSEGPPAIQSVIPSRVEQVDFLRTYFRKVTVALSTGDPSGFLALSSEECGSCAVIARSVVHAYDDGGSITGGKWRVESPTYAGKSSLGLVWDIDVVTAREHWYDGDGNLVNVVRQSTQRVAIALETANEGLRVRELRLR